jgi:hypothetical protein
MAAQGLDICFGCEPPRSAREDALEIEFTDGAHRETDLVMFATGRGRTPRKLGLEPRA